VNRTPGAGKDVRSGTHFPRFAKNFLYSTREVRLSPSPEQAILSIKTIMELKHALIILRDEDPNLERNERSFLFNVALLTQRC
jgi:hypothetical protein